MTAVLCGEAKLPSCTQRQAYHTHLLPGQCYVCRRKEVGHQYVLPDSLDLDATLTPVPRSPAAGRGALRHGGQRAALGSLDANLSAIR